MFSIYIRYLHRTIDVEQVTCELLMYAASSSTIISVGGKYQMGPSKGYITEQVTYYNSNLYLQHLKHINDYRK